MSFWSTIVHSSFPTLTSFPPHFLYITFCPTFTIIFSASPFGVTFPSPTGTSKALVLSGYSPTGKLLTNNWSTQDGIYWVDFSTENHTLDTLAIGASVISYDNKLLLFGKRIINGKNHYKVSIDEGLSWKTPDTLRNILPAEYESRNYQSVVVFKPRPYNKSDSKKVIEDSNRIFIIGGESNTLPLSDIWTGKLNRKNFLLQ